VSKRSSVELATLHGSVGERVSLGWAPRIVRQRRSKKPNATDPKWIMVHGAVHCPEGDWTFRDESLTEEEAVQLVEFLSVRPWGRRRGGDVRSIEFIEPCLVFSTRGELGGRLNLDICFRGEVAPPFIRGGGDAVWHTGWTLGLFVTDDELRRFTDSLRRMLGG
jgi:hypothetical protein